jgi:hypothetical protein
MGIEKGGGKRIPVTIWMGHEVGREGDGEQPFSGPGGRRRGDKEVSGDHMKWKGVMITLFISHIGRRRDEKFFDMDRKEGSVIVLGMEVVGWLAWGKTDEARLCLICKCLHG